MKNKRCTSRTSLKVLFPLFLGLFVFCFLFVVFVFLEGEDQRNRMVAIVGQIEQGKFFVVDVVLADKCLYFCGNDVMQKELFDAGEKGNTYRNEIIEEDEGMYPKHK